MQRCSSCHHYRYPPTYFCDQCRSPQSDWVDVSGAGTVFSWIVVRHPIPREVFGDAVPYVVALIELKEGPRIASNIIGCDVDSVTSGMAVQVVFEDLTPDVSLPKFRPVAGATAVPEGRRGATQ